MNWYYVAAGQPVGPVEDAQLDALRQEGRITDDTLIFREGLTTWQPYRVARGGLPAAAAAGAASGPQVVCHECKRLLAMEDTIRHGEYHVCAACKPQFMQKLAEGAVLEPPALHYAGFWIRFGAIFVDSLIVNAVQFCVIFAVAALVVGAEGDFGSRPVMLLINFVFYGFGFVLYMLYYGLMVGRYGATLGKMACGLRVVRADGGPVSTARAMGRALAWMLSAMICYIGFIMAAFDGEKRALHDHICSTRVIYK